MTALQNPSHCQDRAKYDAVIGLVLVFKQDRLEDTGSNFRSADSFVLDSNFDNVSEKLFFLVLQPGKNSQVHDWGAV